MNSAALFGRLLLNTFSMIVDWTCPSMAQRLRKDALTGLLLVLGVIDIDVADC